MRVACLLVALALAVTACGDAEAEPDGLLGSLCSAIEADTAEAAANIFETQVHGPLHTFADEVGAEDRALAARVLEAKFDVESAVRDDVLAPAVLRERLEVLTGSVREALAALGRPAPVC